MTGISKEDVLTWFQDLNASQRVDLICALLDRSLPFELRFLGSVIENLGRKDFHILRDAECKANSLHSSEATQNPTNILKFLTEGPSIGAIPVQVQTGNAGSSSSSISANTNVQAANASDVSVTRPGSSLKSDQKGTTGDGSKSTPESLPVENGITSKSTSVGGTVVSPDAKANERSIGRLNNKGDGISDEENDLKRDVWLYDQTKRRKLILYLSLLQATNHDSANSYFLLLSDVQDLMVNLDWLEDLEEMNQDEILLLYTIGSHHPAFTFEQRSFLSTVFNRFKECLPRYLKSYVQGFPSSSSPLPNQILNHTYISPQQFDKGVLYPVPVYCPPPHQLVQQPSPQSANPQSGSAMDAVRPITYSLNSYPYPSYQVFMSAPNHGSVNHHPQQFPTHPFPQNATPSHLAIQGPVVPPNGLPTQVIPIPPSTLPLPSQSPVGMGAAVPQKGHPSNTGNPPGSAQSHQSSISTPTRTSSMASAVTAYQSQENSLDGDSEGSCAWDSLESSPFESPPQSLTPSRSQSPRTGTQNTKNVHMSSLNLSSTTSTTISCHGSTHTITNSTSQPCLKADSGSNSLHQISVHSSGPAQHPRPVHKSQSTQERKSRTNTSGHNSGGQVSNNLPCTSAASSPSLLPTTNPPPSSLATVSATTSTSASTTSPITRTQQCSSSCNHPANPGQCCNLNTSAQVSQLCSTVNASTSTVTAGETAPNSLPHNSLSNKLPPAASYSSNSGSVSAGSTTSSSSSNVLNSVNTSAYGNSIVSSSPTYPLVTPQHHPQSHNPLATAAASNSYTGCVESFYNGSSSTGLIAASTGYGPVLKGSSSSSMHSQSSQGRQSKSNTSSNNPQQQLNSVIVHQAPTQQQQQQQHMIQQLMQQQLVNQMQSSTGQAVNAVTHSMNTPLLAYGHPTSHGGHANYSGYPSGGGMNYGGLGGQGYRPGTQVSMIGRSNAFIQQTHPGQMLSNPLAMKQDNMRNHVTTGHNSQLRQKNPSVVMPNQNTPKRRTTSNAATNNSSISGSASNSLNQNNGKEESNDIGDRTNNVMVVSANPTKQDNRGRIYHHPNSKYSNGPLVPDRNATSYSGQANTNQLINSPSGNPGLSIHNVQSKSEDIVSNDSGMSEYNVSTSQVSPYPTNLPIYGHPGNAYIVPNGYVPYYQNPIGGTGAGPQGPPPTEILMNPGHMHPQYPYPYQFTIPQSNYNIGLSKQQSMSVSNSVGKDSSKTQGNSDVSKVMASLNDLSFGRPGPPSNSQSSGSGSTVSASGITPMPSHSPLSNQSGRRGVLLEVGGQGSVTGSDFQPNLAALENALMPPLDDPLDVNCRPRKISCYNCGSNNHVGPECKEASMEEMTRKQYRLNYGGPSADSKDGD